ncbi:hypothetical protein ES705_44576 [subsurface metagenome]
MAKLFSKMKTRFNNIYIKTYINEEVTIENIKKAKELLQSSCTDDTFVLFIAGHGMYDRDECATYYYFTHNVDVSNLSETAASFEMIEDILQGIAPRKKLFLIDTCESGEIDESVKEIFFSTAKKLDINARTNRGISIVEKRYRIKMFQEQVKI